MTRTIMKAVGAVAAGRNRKVHMKTVGVTIYCDEGSMGSNPALPQKEAVYLFRQPLFYIQPILIAISLDIISCLK